MKKTTLAILLFCLFAAGVQAAPVFGPFHATACGKGPGHVQWFDGTPPTEPHAEWTISAWVKPSAAISAPALVAGFGDGADHFGSQRYLCADANGWFFWYGGFRLVRNPETKQSAPSIAPDRLASQVVPKPGVWQHLAATYDGRILRLFVNGEECGQSSPNLTRAAMQPMVAPPPAWKEGACFTGQVADFTIWNRAMSGRENAGLTRNASSLDARSFARAPVGPTPTNRTDAAAFANGRRNLQPQPPETFPKPVPTVEGKRIAKLTERPIPLPNANGDLLLDRGWEMADAASVAATPGKISAPGFDTREWYDATVPGTALTTLVQQGVYPEPTHGLNNQLIPDLATKSWWYRVEFPTPDAWKNRRLELCFKGINYHAEIWLNGRPLGGVTGAFLRRRFNVTAGLVNQGHNVLAVRVWPQPHYSPGTGESSVAFGPGIANGADALLDGPTFFCTEGWDWTPTTRDRCTGIWQDVVLRPSGAVTVADPQVITRLPKLPDLSVAELTLKADVRNLTSQPRSLTLEAEIAGARLTQKLSLVPGETRTVTFTPADFPQLSIQNPRLWWPNGYGEPTLHELNLRVLDQAGGESDRLALRVGLRQVDYEYLPKTAAPDMKTEPFLIKVNGRRIFVRGGNWGLDEILKRSSTARLEPAFRLHRDANLNMIRNWCGQNTQENFYELADQYGLLVWNDFWLSTIGGNLPAVDAERFLANAEDVIKRYRSHACIAVWCGRNEGTPPGWINSPLAESLKSLDGTRIYLPSSFKGNLMPSGPWTYKDPKWYFTDHAQGFSTELGVNSIPTADALRAMLDPCQYWPWKNNDAWAYHDFPTSSHGNVTPFLEAAEQRYGPGTDLESFIHRMQMANYTHHRVMFEAFNSKMWQPATGLIIWMSHPAWPSMVWQLYTSDFDTHAAYFGAKKACEPIHVQWNLDDDTAAIVNATCNPIPQAALKVLVCALDGSILKETRSELSVKASQVIKPAKIAWADSAAHPVQFLKLELRDRAGELLSENFYWRSQKPEQLRALEGLPKVALAGKMQTSSKGDEMIVTTEFVNPSHSVALMAHLVLRNATTNARILPSYVDDNYFSLLPGEKKTVTIRCPTKNAAETMSVTLDGWNIIPTTFH